MRIAKIAALIFTALCLVFAGASLLRPATMTFCTSAPAVGSPSLAGDAGGCRTVDCGSAASPKGLIDFYDHSLALTDPAQGDGVQADAINCAGVPSASTGLYGILLAGLGLIAVAITSRRGPANETTSEPNVAASI